MRFPEPFGYYLDPLEGSGLPYCVTGSVAAGIYGELRTTNDIDFVLVMKVSDIEQFRITFPEQDYYVPPTEVLLTALLRPGRGALNLVHHWSGFKADLFFAVRDPLHLWAMKHRRRGQYFAEQLWVAPPEYVVIRKLEYYREGRSEKHVSDVCSMLNVTPVDHDFIAAQNKRLGLQEQWDEVWRAFLETGGKLPA